MYLCIPEGNRILSMSRKDYSISTGFGFNVISTKQFNYYLQLCGGIGIIDGSYEHFTPNNGTERIDIKHTSDIWEILMEAIPFLHVLPMFLIRMLKN